MLLLAFLNGKAGEEGTRLLQAAISTLFDGFLKLKTKG